MRKTIMMYSRRQKHTMVRKMGDDAVMKITKPWPGGDWWRRNNKNNDGRKRDGTLIGGEKRRLGGEHREDKHHSERDEGQSSDGSRLH
jgi:hypothetical protein